MTGNRTGATELSGRTVSWSFDGIYRLTGETVTNDPSKYNGSVNYGLDPVGNRLSQSSSLHDIASNGFSYNADDELAGEMYDANGNVTATGGKTYSYDSQNHLISANGGAVALVYDGDGNRVAKTVSGSTTRYLVDDLNPTGYAQVVEETVNGAATRTYTYGLQRINEDQVISNVWTVSYYGYDGFGTVRQLTNSAGAVTDTYEYDGFGNEITSTGTTPNNYLYRGEQYDPDLGLYYLRARYYNPLTGRFMSRDPNADLIAIPVTLHKYIYAGDNPVTWSDPTGRDIIEDTLIISNKSIGAVQYLNTIGCVANIGLAVASSELNGWTEGDVVSGAYGCVSAFFGPEGNALLVLKRGLDWGTCAFGLAQVVNDLNEERLYQNVNSATFYEDAFGGVLGCAITGIGGTLESGGQ